MNYRFFLTYMLVISSFFLIFSNDPPVNPVEERLAAYEQELEERNQALAIAATQAEAQAARARVEETEQGIYELYRENGARFQSVFTNLDTLPPEERIIISQALSAGDECENSMWGFLCSMNADQKREDLYIQRFETILGQQTRNVNSQGNTDPSQFGIEDNSATVSLLNNEIQGLEGMNGFGGCTNVNGDCRSSIVNHNCGNNAACEESRDIALQLFETSEQYYQIESNAVIKLAQFLKVDPGSYAVADMITGLLGVDVSLLKEGSSLDQILKWGTPEQVCLAKVESFVSIDGVEYEGSAYDVTDEYTGMTSRQKMCDDLSFTVCADLRAERTGVFFNGSFSLIAHLYVYNSQDYDQDIVLSAEVIDGSGSSYKFNLFNESGQFGDNISLRLSSGQTFSQSIYIPELQVFEGQIDGNLNGNVLLSVHESGKGSLDSQSGFDYAIDYPIVEMSSGPLTQAELVESGATYLEGTSIYSTDLIDRVVID